MKTNERSDCFGEHAANASHCYENDEFYWKIARYYRLTQTNVSPNRSHIFLFYFCLLILFCFDSGLFLADNTQLSIYTFCRNSSHKRDSRNSTFLIVEKKKKILPLISIARVVFHFIYKRFDWMVCRDFHCKHSSLKLQKFIGVLLL